MTIADLSQYNPVNEAHYMYGDPEIFRAMTMAASNAVIEDLRQNHLELTTDADSMAALREHLNIPADIGLAITVLRAADVAEVMPDGLEFLNDSPESLGFCFSVGIQNDGRDVLELFVALDGSRYPDDDGDEPSDEQVEAILELNHYIITQLLIGLDGDDSDDEPSDEVFAQLEEKANTVLETMLDEGIAPLLAVIPGEDD